MRTAYKVWTGIAAGVFVIVAISDLSSATTSSSSSSRTTASSSTATTVPQTTTGRAAAPVARQPTGDVVTVARVVDGDTFETTGGRTIQVLGIDACEPGTYGGDEATSRARGLLSGAQVTLTTEPGVTTDRHGNELAYVATPTGDLGEYAVIYPDTTVYEKHGASAARLAALRSADDGPQSCADPYPVTSSASGDTDVDIDTDVDLPLPRPGDQGLPDGLLTGGYCAKKWWC
ncbi:thermonuclease family protein [Pseudonocardia sp. WMMC193]|uniref:thermonuclease family protein n=1 Tax=Pseudonocardia sp. WMMC193 TaxID=2911965 RepID=UPI001F3A42AC|nr:hypothetical protein [Pseudonocardia sp. WMMC193]MCF7551590.1 hypothetical protein [Pseudonocardia sp. WMMC193]